MFRPISTRSGLRKADQEPVVKSASRVPTARMRSASAAAALAGVVPVTPMAPRLSGWLCGKADLPAWVSTTGMPWAVAKAASAAQAPE